MEKRIQYDLEYIQSWSLLLDIKIVFNVFPRICGEKCVLNSLSSRVYWRFLTHGRTCRLNHIPVWLASISRAVGYDVGYNDNVTRQRYGGNEIGSAYQGVKPIFKAIGERYEDRYLLMYSGDYRRYASDSADNRDNHFYV